MPQSGKQRFAITLRQPYNRNLIRCRSCGYEGRVLEMHIRFHWSFLPIGFLLGCTGLGLIPLVAFIVYLGRLTWNACPACGAKSRLAAWRGAPTPDSEDIWRQAVEQDRREFLRTKLAMTAVAALVVCALILYLLIQLWF